MKKIEAFIKPEKLEDIKDVFNAMNISGLSISEVMGFGTQKGWKNFVRGSEVDVNFTHKLKLEIVTLDELAEEIIDKICETLQTGEIGDGKIFVYDVQDAVRIRTLERGKSALE